MDDPATVMLPSKENLSVNSNTLKHEAQNSSPAGPGPSPSLWPSASYPASVNKPPLGPHIPENISNENLWFPHFVISLHQ